MPVAPATRPLQESARRIWTVGHSTRSAPELVSLLRSRGVELVADVRRYPASRRHPHFGRESLEAILAGADIAYLHLPELGGRREAHPDSVNTGWRETGFRGYADYMSTASFAAGLARLVQAASQRVAMLCAEQAWRNCHRGLIADALKAAGHYVVHIVDAGRDEEHPYTEPARIVDGRLGYAADAPRQAGLDFS